MRACLLVFSTVSCPSLANSLCRAACSLGLNMRKYNVRISRQSSRSREVLWPFCGRVLRSDQSDCSLPRGRELNLDFTG